MNTSNSPNTIIAQIESLRSRRVTGETLLTLAVPAEHSAKISSFLTRVGEMVGVAFAEIESPKNPPRESAAPATESKVAGRTIGLAEHLHRSGYFRNIKLWAALEAHSIYTQVQHKKWVEGQPCHFIRLGNYNGDICAHHTPSAALPAAGKGSNPRKPPHWFTIPTCHTHHDLLHGKEFNREQKVNLVEQAVELIAGQAKVMVKLYFGIDSLAGLTQEALNKFEHEIGLPLTHYHVDLSEPLKSPNNHVMPTGIS